MLKYVDRESTHRPTTFKSIAKGVFTRLARLTSEIAANGNARIDEVYLAGFLEADIFFTNDLAARVGLRGEHSKILGKYNISLNGTTYPIEIKSGNGKKTLKGTLRYKLKSGITADTTVNLYVFHNKNDNLLYTGYRKKRKEAMSGLRAM